MIATEEQRLEALRSSMTDKQRKDMAEIIANELKRREGEKMRGTSTDKKGMSQSDLQDIYRESAPAVAKAREEKIRQRLEELRLKAGGRGKEEVGGRRTGWQATVAKRVVPPLIAMVVLGVGVARVIMLSDSEGLVTVEEGARGRLTGSSGSVAESLDAPPVVTDMERQLLLELDTRRAELDKKRDIVERRQSELAEQERALSIRLQELKVLTDQLERHRSEHNQDQEDKLGQLAQVYGSMTPQEAAALLGKLEEGVALALLERMPGKRMGQILGLMDKERAVELTKALSGRGGKVLSKGEVGVHSNF